MENSVEPERKSRDASGVLVILVPLLALCTIGFYYITSTPSGPTNSQSPTTTELPERSASTQEIVPDDLARAVYAMQIEEDLRKAGSNVRVEAAGGSHDTLQIKAGVELDAQSANSILNGLFSNESLMTNLKSYGFKNVEVDSAPSKEVWRGYDKWIRPLRAIAQPVPPPSAVSISNLTLLAEPVSSLTDVDFTNRSYRLNNTELQIKSGVYHYQQDGGFEDIKVREIWFLKDPRDGAQYAVVSLYDVSGGGSSNDEGIVQVFTVANKRLELVQELNFDEQASGSGVKFDSNSRCLTIRARSNDDSPHCCATNLDVADFVWSGRGFTLTSVVRIPVEPHSLR